jgi:uncharacterized membrane protein YfcA
MWNYIISIILGLFVGLYSTFTGTTAGSAILIYLLLFLNIIPSQTVITGTVMLLSSVPIGLFGVYEFYKNNKINYGIALAIMLGLAGGYSVGSIYAVKVNKVMGEKIGDKIKFGLTSVVYLILAVLYFFEYYNRL